MTATTLLTLICSDGGQLVEDVRGDANTRRVVVTVRCRHLHRAGGGTRLAYTHEHLPFRQWRLLAHLAEGYALVTAQAALERRGPMQELAWLLASRVSRRA